jgi:hypothetical protein
MAERILRLQNTWAPGQFIPGGKANKYIDTRLRQTVTLARAVAPKRTTKLSRSTHKTGTLNRGPLGAVGAVYNDAPYASFVVVGTLGRVIGPRGPNPMPIPKQGVKLPYRHTGMANMYFPVGPGHRKKTVRGQKGNDFLKRSMEMAFKIKID